MFTGLLYHIWLRPITLHCSSNVFSFLSQITHQSLSKISKCHARCKEIYRQAVTLYKSETRHVTGLIELCTDRRAVLLCSAWPGLRWARVGDGATGPPAFPVLTLTGLVCLYVGTKQFSLRFPLCSSIVTQCAPDIAHLLT